MVNEIYIDLPVANQFDQTHDPAWASRICAICSLWMLLKLHDPNFNVSVMELTKKGLDQGVYLENIGWKHAGIVAMAEEYGLELRYAEKFFYTPEEKDKGLQVINRNLRAGQPVIASIFLNLDPAKGGHMVVIHGMQEFSDTTIGYSIQDPDGRFRGHNYFLTRQEFLDGWRGGLIYGK